MAFSKTSGTKGVPNLLHFTFGMCLILNSEANSAAPFSFPKRIISHFGFKCSQLKIAFLWIILNWLSKGFGMANMVIMLFVSFLQLFQAGPRVPMQTSALRPYFDNQALTV